MLQSRSGGPNRCRKTVPLEDIRLFRRIYAPLPYRLPPPHYLPAFLQRAYDTVMSTKTATCCNLHIRSPSDARVIFHAVRMNILPIVNRRLDTEERQRIASGDVYVWEERAVHAELTGVGIERWTDGIRWGPSRVRDGFLFYQEKRERSQHSDGYHYDNMSRARSEMTVLNKQTYTVFVDTPKGQRKWHLIAYFTQESLPRLKVIDSYSQLMVLQVPHGNYQSARHPKGRPEHIFNPPTERSNEFVPYIPTSRPTSPALSSNYPSYSHSSPVAPQPLVWLPSGYPDGPPRYADSPTSSSASGESFTGPRGGNGLPPLAYLQSRPAIRRHPEDEKTLMLLRPPL